jgi:DNA-binding NtrC family response regulator
MVGHVHLVNQIRASDLTGIGGAHAELRDPVGRDDALKREVLAHVLKDEGLEVIECTTGEAAELIIASTGTELQALVTDHNLAGAMSGAALAGYARSRHPHMNIIIMSGRTVYPIPVGTMFLQKPFSPAQLLDAVRN